MTSARFEPFPPVLSGDDIRELVGEHGCNAAEVAAYCRLPVLRISQRMRELGVLQRPRMWKWAD